MKLALVITFTFLFIASTTSYKSSGQFISHFVPKANAIAIDGIVVSISNIDSITLPHSGIWEVSGIYMDSITGGSMPTTMVHSLSTVSRAITSDTLTVKDGYDPTQFPFTIQVSRALPVARFTISGATKVYHVAQALSTGCDVHSYGYMTATKLE